MTYSDPELASTVQKIIEITGTFAFAISGIRHAAAKHVDWFGGLVCGIAVAIGGGTLRDVMLGVTPFWMTSSVYMVCTVLALLSVIVFAKYVERLSNTWFVFDTLGLALFTIAGLQKALALGQPFWVAIIMGCITGAAGGVVRDVLLNNVPVIFQKEIYAMASIAGGALYWALYALGVEIGITVVSCFLFICLVRFLAMRYHISLPMLREQK
ncbi:trimeric intracellular cation channel family protein [Prevotella sp. oral taxon 475]|uniref:trimeric intracellular cation channel family protein n=1 Tax=Prevotella sp. oral taxon 475 TaxID=712471 RepID=UPI001BA95A3D|nr:trimeric intracellular cation channel family protein [Prevotella sp. oral taxon 475]QUB46708.1 trimeric intracellular cation channel family protein [Prevotella sp. oral taxon 475]